MEYENRRKEIEEIVKLAAKRYDVLFEKLRFIGGFQNIIYELKKNNEFYILRLTDFSHRSKNNVIGELDWITYLADQGVTLSLPVLSCSGKLAEIIVYNDTQMTAVLFRKAPGVKLQYPEYLNTPAIFKQLGALTGRIHQVSKSYKSRSSAVKRHHWFENYYLKNIYKFIPKENEAIYNAYEQLRSQLMSLKQDEESYGLIHGDINLGNFCIENNVITLFDFDECQYSWFVEDIAVQLFYTVYVLLDDSPYERKVMADSFMTHFMNGYLRENNLEKYWLEQLPLFLKLRELIVHIGIYRSWDFNSLNQWQKDYITQSDTRIKNGIPLVEFNEEWCKVIRHIL